MILQKRSIILALGISIILFIIFLSLACPAGPPIFHIVSFESNGGSAVDALVDVAHGGRIDAPADPIFAGRGFSGWFKDQGFNTAWNFAVDRVIQDTTLYAKWTMNTYTVSFSCNGGSAVADITEVLPNAKITEPDDPTWTYRLFWGWYSDSSLNYKWDFDVDVVTENITLYANWTFGGTGPGGGLVFYENANYAVDGWRYLEAAPKVKELGSLSWASSGNSDLVVGTTGSSIGTGQANTTAIVNKMGLGSYAAKYCADLIYGTKDDWFLPSIDEAKAMRDNLYCDYVGGFTNDNYWSSTETCQYNVKCLRFDAGTHTAMHPASAQGNIYTRPIRAFQEVE